MQFHSKWILLLLFLIPAMIYYNYRKKRHAALKFSSLRDMRNCTVSLRQRLRSLMSAARYICIALLIIALARPQRGTVLSEISSEGVAMEVVADRSGSMRTDMDYYGQTLTRFDAVKKVLSDFIEGDKKGLTGRESDIIGLVTFARYADTICPMVLSHNVLLEFLKNTDIVKLESEDGTAIGDGISLAAARLKTAEEDFQKRKQKLVEAGEYVSGDNDGDFKIKSKVIILLTDGINNAGQYDPMRAAELAKEWGIKIYTIGIGSAESYMTIQTLMGNLKVPSGQSLDENLLKNIAETTGGFYGRADDAQTLHKIIEKINELEKTEVKSFQIIQYSEFFSPWTLTALSILLLEILASCTVFRKVP